MNQGCRITNQIRDISQIDLSTKFRLIYPETEIRNNCIIIYLIDLDLF